MPPSSTVPAVRWIGPHGGADLGPCWRLLNLDVHWVEAGGDLTVLACPRPLVETAAAQSFLQEVSGERFVQLLGVWCEGEGRTGRLVEGAQRVFWHAWPAWWREWRLDWSGRQARPAAAPLPLRRELAQRNRARQGLPRLVRIDSHDGQLAQGLIAALEGAGVAALWSRRFLAADADAIVWDGAQMSGREAAHLAAVCSAARNRKVPVVALLDFPRPETVAAARSVGAADVLGKPFTAELLLDALCAAQREAAPASLGKLFAQPVNAVRTRLAS